MGANGQFKVGYPDESQCIKIFLVGSLSSLAQAGAPGGPTPVSIISTVSTATTLAHEVGHYFGLAHTFQGTATPVFPNFPNYAQYVNSPVTLSDGNTYTCYETGDFICDTPADPGNCTGLTCEQSSCVVTPTDPLGAHYTPDRHFIMSYYSQCRSTFSPEQN